MATVTHSVPIRFQALPTRVTGAREVETIAVRGQHVPAEVAAAAESAARRVAADCLLSIGGLTDGDADEAAEAIVAVTSAVPAPVTRAEARAILQRAMATGTADG